MNIIGINGLGILPSVCHLLNGNIQFISEEERYSRLKGSDGLMPIKSLEVCFKESNLSLNDIDYLAFGWDCSLYRFKYPLYMLFKYLTRGDKITKSSNFHRFILEILKYNPSKVKEDIKNAFIQAGIKGKLPLIKFVSHHLSHAASSYFSSGFDKSYILVIDGSGEYTSTSIFKGEGSQITKIKTYSIPDSLGWFYQSITEFLGFKSNSHEGKLMGLAPYGKNDIEINYMLQKILFYNKKGEYRLDARYNFFGSRSKGMVYSDAMVDLLGQPRQRDEPISDFHKNLAFCTQQMLEKHALSLVNEIKSYPDFNGNLCIAGGVGLNCKMNGRIAMLDKVKNIYVPPFTSDVGTSVGAAMVVANNFGILQRKKINHAYWSTAFTDSEIEEELIKLKVPYQKLNNIEKEVAALIFNNYIVGWFQGKMECGPRALGARSILANPTQLKIKDEVNRRVKFRENWRPFAASILYEDRAIYFEKDIDSPFMAIALPVKPDAAILIPAAVHVDNTTRPQLVEKEVNSIYWTLINEFKKLSGVGALLNTSFNVDEEPIVENPKQAIRTFYGSGMDYLAIGSFLLSKNDR